MFVEEQIRKPLFQFLTQCYLEGEATKLEAATFLTRVGKPYLLRLGLSRRQQAEFCAQAGTRIWDCSTGEFSNREFEAFDDFIDANHPAQQARMVPAKSLDDWAIEPDTILEILNELAAGQGSKFEGEVDAIRQEGVFCTELDFSEMGFVFRLALTAQLHSRPSITDDVEVYSQGQLIGSFSFSSLFGLGAWRPCKVNDKATKEQLTKSLSEPLFLFWGVSRRIALSG